jgi:prepilin-type N-terminal cleavage/methylation domain-containing protein
LVITRHSGFTLLEMLVVLALLAMVYALIPPMIAVGGSTTELKAGARQVAAGLRKARSQAIVSRGEATLTLDVEARSFRLSGDDKPRNLPRQRKSVSTPPRARSSAIPPPSASIRTAVPLEAGLPWPWMSANSTSMSTGSPARSRFWIRRETGLPGLFPA